MSATDDYTSCTFGQPGPGCALVRITGELDLCSAPRVEEEITSRLEPGCDKLVIDLADVQFIDSSGIRVLLQVLSQAKPCEETVLVYPRSRIARRALEVIGLEKVVRTVDSIQDALEIE